MEHLLHLIGLCPDNFLHIDLIDIVAALLGDNSIALGIRQFFQNIKNFFYV